MSGENRAKRLGEPSCREESTVIADYNQLYRTKDREAVVALERSVYGSDFGVTSYTTVAQVERLLGRLRLGPTDRVLDIGTGSGWPGLYLSLETACELVATDLPIEGLLAAARRVRKEGISSRVSLVLCSGRGLPFRQRTFDAIVHADVLC